MRRPRARAAATASARGRSRTSGCRAEAADEEGQRRARAARSRARSPPAQPAPRRRARPAGRTGRRRAPAGSPAPTGGRRLHRRPAGRRARRRRGRPGWQQGQRDGRDRNGTTDGSWTTARHAGEAVAAAAAGEQAEITSGRTRRGTAPAPPACAVRGSGAHGRRRLAPAQSARTRRTAAAAAYQLRRSASFASGCPRQRPHVAGTGTRVLAWKARTAPRVMRAEPAGRRDPQSRRWTAVTPARCRRK